MVDIGIEIGGTNMRVATITPESVGAIQKVPTPQDPREALEQLATLAREAAAGDAIGRVVAGMPGVISADGVVHKSPNLPQWHDLTFAQTLGTKLNASVSLHNDADVDALGEAHFGAGKEFGIVGFLVCGTGVGGRRVVHGTVDDYAYGSEPGKQIIDPATGQTLEKLISGRAVGERYNMHPRDVPRDVWDSLTPALARGIYTALLFWSPHAFVLGGSVFRDPNSFQIELIESELQKLNTVYPELPVIRRGALGDDAGLHGCRALLAGM